MGLELSRRRDGGAEVKRGFEKDVLPKIGMFPAEEVGKVHIIAVLDGILARGANCLANRTLSELRQMFGFGLVRDIVKTDPTHRIIKADIGGQEVERDRVLDELRQVYRGVAAVRWGMDAARFAAHRGNADGNFRDSPRCYRAVLESRRTEQNGTVISAVETRNRAGGSVVRVG